MLCLDFFLLSRCASIIGFWFVVTVCVCVYTHTHTHTYIHIIILSCWSLKFKHILTTLHFYFPLYVLQFLISYFTSFCFVYPLTTYCGYRWLYYFCHLTFLLALYVIDLLPLLYICLYQWDFSFHNFQVSICGLFFFS